MLAASVGIVPAGMAAGGSPAGRPFPRRASCSGWPRASSRPATSSPGRGVSARRPVGRLPDRPRDRAAPRGRRRRRAARRAARARGVARGRRCLLAGFLVLQRPWRASAGPRGGDEARRTIDRDRCSPWRPASRSRPTPAIDRVGTRLIEPADLRCDPVGDVRRRARAWVTVVAGGDIFAAGRVEVAIGRGRRLADARRLSPDPRRAQRRAAVGRGAIARIGDGVRSGLGLRPAGRGGRSRRDESPDRGVRR